ncbi:hypothetical protein HU200_057686 [Digitaria exilis]|uniref:non-specific serine/threonine protein kinase n=1 Tax=Digitaria exilis TaxID=1010633 RepID=A0A835E0X6_9POAL|nr:hypothetical protein HU200_057686 [Digitaria exilis]
MAVPRIKFLYLPALISSVLLLTSTATILSTDTLNNGGKITDGETLVSANGTFTLGFFSGESPSKRYLGIWFTASGVNSVLWVANLFLILIKHGRRLICRCGGDPASRVRQPGGGQSFDHPSNTLLAGMRFGENPQTGEEWSLTSWRAPNDPSTGDYRLVLDTMGLPAAVMWQGTGSVKKKYSTGPWNGLRFSGVPEIASYSGDFSVEVVVFPDEVACVFNASAGAPLSRIVLTDQGVLERLAWDPANSVWDTWMQSPRDFCDSYAICGAFGPCDEGDVATQLCGCIDGFSPASPEQWSTRDTSGGCRRDVPLECGNNGTTTDGFKVLHGQCHGGHERHAGAVQGECLANCSCVAYAPADIRDGGSGCVMWNGDIVDVRYLDNGQELYVRLRGKTTLLKFLRGDVKKKAKLGFLSASNDLGDEDIDLPFVSFGDIVSATNNFSEDNLLGQGGFGKVYKGMMEDRSEVAIKRLGKGSRQGTEEFKNEVVLIAKLQHRNLVRLLGC